MEGSFLNIYLFLSLKEQQEFRRYFQALYPGNQIANRSLDYLETLQSGTTLDEKVLFKHAFKREMHNDGDGRRKDRVQIQNIFSDLKKQVLAFLLWQEIRQNTGVPDKQFMLLDLLHNKGLSEVYQEQLTRLEKKMATNVNKSLEEYYWDTKLYHNLYYNKDKASPERREDIDHLIASLDRFYLASKLKYACEVLARMHILQEGRPDFLITDLLAMVDQSPYRDEPVINMYRRLIDLIGGDDTVYDGLKHILLENTPANVADSEALAMYLLNFSASMIRQGRMEYKKESFDLYKFSAEKKLLMLHGFFPTDPFHNIVNLACHFKELKWANAFIESCGQNIPIAERDWHIGLCKARVCFEEGKFVEAIKLLRPLPLKGFSFGLHVRILWIRCHYEVDSPSSVIRSACNAMHNYLTRDKEMGENIKLGAFAFVFMIRKMMIPTPKQVLSNYLEKQPFIFAKAWFESKINALPDHK